MNVSRRPRTKRGLHFGGRPSPAVRWRACSGLPNATAAYRLLVTIVGQRLTYNDKRIPGAANRLQQFAA
eukprot:11895151-Alexandrium_andersonii.AAC.1